MGKLLMRAGICLLLVAAVWTGSLLADRHRLDQDVIRLHVVANSDRSADQETKLRVQDAVIKSLQDGLKAAADTRQARIYLEENLPKIRQVARRVLRELGCGDAVTVSLCREAFDTRNYDGFSLPAGVYEALRIVIGEGEGKNWWCVVFPCVCLPRQEEHFDHVTAAAGFPEPLRNALMGNGGYELRFAALELLGRLENTLWGG